MAKRALLDVLESTIGRYVLNLDAKSLNVAVWSGKIELTNLSLDIDAVNSELARRAREAPNLAVPLRVVSGQFDSLRVEVPWARITSRPVVLKARGFTVVVEPYDHLAGETDVAGKARREIRRDALVRADEERKRRNALWKVTALDLAEGAASKGDDGGVGDGDGTERSGRQQAATTTTAAAPVDATFTAKLVRRIVENLQLEVTDFRVSLQGCGCSAGVVLGSLSVATTDANGRKKFVDRVDDAQRGKTSFLYKALTIDGFGAYCDGETVGGDDGAITACDGAAEDADANANANHSYILSPMTFEASICKCDHDTENEFPKYLLQSQIPSLSAILTRSQLEMTNRITAALAQSKDVVRPLFPEYRPTSDIARGTTKQWWKYAVRCIGRLNRRRSWAEFFLAYRKRRRYIPLYMRHAAHLSQEDATATSPSSWLKPLTDPERSSLQSLEEDHSVSVEGIMIWRNIADAQVEQEKSWREADFVNEMLLVGQPKAPAPPPPPSPGRVDASMITARSHDTAVSAGGGGGEGGGGRPALHRAGTDPHLASIFSSARMDLSSASSDDLDDETPPITLTAKQLKEIESVMFGRAESDVSTDAKLYDLNFTLGEFTVDLISSDPQRHLASLFMGTAETSFNAKADGSFTFDFTMASLRVDDRITPNTLFPSIVQSLQTPPNDTSGDSAPLPHAFDFRLAKSKSGDQELTVKMVAMEIVAPSLLLKEVKDFFALAPPRGEGNMPQLPAPEGIIDVLETSSGDVFFDAPMEHDVDPMRATIIGVTAGAAASAAAVVSDALTSSIVDAWNSKRESKKAWTIELDLHAPVLVLPQSSVDPMATTLVADLGRFVIVFGTNAKPPAKVKEWFDSRRSESDESEAASVDYCNLTMNKFTMLIGKAGVKDWRVSSTSASSHEYSSSQAIIEPMSLSLCVGLENSADKGDAAGTCVLGVLPSISVMASMPQINDVLSLIDTWTTFLGTLGGNGQEVQPERHEPAIDLSQISKQYLESMHESRIKEVEKVYVELSLRRMSAKLMTERGDGLEAHLVSIVFSTSLLDDGSTSSRLGMGYVWIFDGLQVDFPRKQRIVAHSSLPRSASSFAKDDAYDIMDELQRQGAFDDDFVGASDLAEVTVTTSPHTAITTISGIFSSLYINFNPLVLRQIAKDMSFSSEDAKPPPIKDVEDLGQSIILSSSIVARVDDDELVNVGAEETVKKGALHIFAQMKGFEILTYSAKDDLPLLRFAMTETKVTYQSSDIEMTVDATLNNLICEDQRETSLRPSFGYIINQGSGDNAQQDLFHVVYKNRDSLTEIDVAIGSPQIVLLSDAIADILEFYHDVWPPQDIQVPIENAEEGKDSKEPIEVPNTTQDTEMIITIHTDPDCRFILVDVGGGSNLRDIAVGEDILSSTKLAGSETKLADTIVLEGKLDAKIRYTGGTTVSSEYEANWEGVEWYTAHGRHLNGPIQILEPSSLSAIYRTSTNQGHNETEMKLWSLGSINFTISMENFALLLAILSSFGDAFAGGSEANNEVSTEESTEGSLQDALTEEETQKIRRLSVALENAGIVESEGVEVPISSKPLVTKSSKQEVTHCTEEDYGFCNQTAHDRDTESARLVRLKVAFPETTMTIINDLQGLDDGLFKLFLRDLLVGGEMHYPASRDAQATSSSQLPAGSEVLKPLFKFELNKTMSADYYDTHTNLWAPLLLQPWESTFSASRAPSQLAGTKRLQTTLNLESDPCQISFSEKFLVSLGAANRMWSAYSFATSEAATANESATITAGATQQCVSSSARDRRQSVLIRNSTAANAARSFVTTLPYLIENHSGVTAYFEVKGQDHRRRCDSGTKEYFRFDPPRGKGIGGKRAYGQFVTQFKSLSLFIGERSISFQHLDANINLPRQTHDLGFGRYIFTEVLRKGRATCLVISSHIEIYNMTSLSFQISLDRDGETHDVGLCPGKNKIQRTASSKSKGQQHNMQAMPEAFGVPVNLLKNFDDRAPAGEDSSHLSIMISPLTEPQSKDDASADGTSALCGAFLLPTLNVLKKLGSGGEALETSEVVCIQVGEGDDMEQKVGNTEKALTVQVTYEVSLIGGTHPCISIYLQPRAILENRMPMKLLIATPMNHTMSASTRTNREASSHDERPGDSMHELEPFDVIEIFSPESLFLISFKLAEVPVSGGVTGWNSSGLSFPLGSQIASPIESTLPYVNEDGSPLENGVGDHIFLLETSDLVSYLAIDEGTKDGNGNTNKGKSDTSAEEQIALRPQDKIRSVCVVVPVFAIDHTGEILFEEVIQGASSRQIRRAASEGYGSGRHTSSNVSQSHPCFGAFELSNRRSRLILLPSPTTKIRLVHPTLDAIGARQSVAFLVNDVEFCEGGLESSAILWENNKAPSGYHAYRKFSSYGQSEIHIVPEFLVFNGSEKVVRILQRTSHDTVLEAKSVGALKPVDRAKGAIVRIGFSRTGMTDEVRVDQIGSKVCIVKAPNGTPVGSVAVQTEPGRSDSRIVIKIGTVKSSTADGALENKAKAEQLFDGDFFRFRARLSELQITMNDTQQGLGASYERNKDAIEAVLGRANLQRPPGGDGPSDDIITEETDLNSQTGRVAQVIIHRLTVDSQRIFRTEKSQRDRGKRPVAVERSQLAIVLHSLQIKDCTPESKFPVVFDSSNARSSFFDLCIRTRGSLDADMVQVDCFDLNVACIEDKADLISIKTDEAFVWKILDVLNRTLVATSDLAGVDLQLDFDEESGEYAVSMKDSEEEERLGGDYEVYQLPRTDRLYDVAIARVSPMKLQVSFLRQPDASRYQKVSGVRGAKMMNYFTTKLTFTVDRAQLKFAGYAARNVKGPPDRLISTIVAVYTTRLKRKAVNLLTAVSLKDWNYLTSREDGEDGYVEGDLLRLTGNVAGRSAGYVLKRVGQGIDEGIRTVTGTIGDEIQFATEMVGAGAVGAGINSAVTGVGEGVGSAVKGAGHGTGKVVRGAVKGIGQVAGGVGGGAVKAARGVGEGVMAGDAGAALSGLGDGVSSAALGVGQGVETVVFGTADGVNTLGKGFLDGLRSLTKGFCGCCMEGGEDSSSSSEDED